MYDAIIKFWTVTLASGNDKATFLSLIIFAVIAVAGIILKWKKVNLEQSDTFSKIDERRFKQLSDQLKESGELLRQSDQESDLLTIERDHYRDKVRDLVFAIKQVYWTFVKNTTGELDKQEMWPIDHPEEIERKAMQSPLEKTYQSDYTPTEDKKPD